MDQDQPAADAEAKVSFACPARLDVAAASDVRLALLTRLASPGSLVVDIGAVAYVDTAGVQLLCAAARAAARQGTGVTWIGASTALASAARQLGVEGVLGLTADPPSK